VYAGSNAGAGPQYADAARSLARVLCAHGRGIVFGGGRIGLMGVLADEALARGGEVIGVIPGHLVERELAHQSLTDLRVVATMHERKALMAELADAFIALPGGIGTLEELVEMLSSGCMPSRSGSSTSAATTTACWRSCSTPSARASCHPPTASWSRCKWTRRRYCTSSTGVRAPAPST